MGHQVVASMSLQFWLAVAVFLTVRWLFLYNSRARRYRVRQSRLLALCAWALVVMSLVELIVAT